MCVYTYMKNKSIKIDLSDCPGCINFNIRKAMRAVSQHYDKIMAPTGLRGTQFTILTVLGRAESLTITELAECLIMDRTTLTRNLKPLEKEGYLNVLPGLEDKRSRRIELTRAGKRAQKMLCSIGGRRKMKWLISWAKPTQNDLLVTCRLRQ